MPTLAQSIPTLVSACEKSKENIVNYYLKEYEEMLREHLDDYLDNYDNYVAAPSDGEA
jgi:predicted metal-dependent hydrolase